MKPTDIAVLPGAVLRTSPEGNGNELHFDQNWTTPEEYDPSKIRQGGWNPKGYMGIISGDLLTGDPASPRRMEVCFLGWRFDDHPEAAPNAGCFEWYLNDTLAMRLTARAGLETFTGAPVQQQPQPAPTQPTQPAQPAPPPVSVLRVGPYGILVGDIDTVTAYYGFAPDQGDVDQYHKSGDWNAFIARMDRRK
jgi:hypothetical protein